MKLGKQEIQKLILGVLILIGVVYSYFDLLLFPEMASQAALKKSIEALGPEINTAQGQVKKTADLQKASPPKLQIIPQVHAMIPDGSPVAWFPTRIGDFFKRQGIDKTAIKMNNEFPEKELPGFRRLAWTVDLSKVDFAQFGTAVCALENEEPLMEITSIQIDASRDDVESQHVVLTLNNLLKQ